MSLLPGSFRPEEISGGEPAIRDSELAEAWAAARALEQAMPADPMRPTVDFADRVMAAVAAEPAPHAAGFLSGLRARPGLGGLVASLRAAWFTAAGGSGRSFGVRAAALAYVFVVLLAAASLTGVAALGTVGAFGLLPGERSPVPSGPVASPSPDQTDAVGPSDSPEPSGSPEPSESAEPSESSGPDDSLEPDESSNPSSAVPGATTSPVGTAPPGVGPSPSSSDDSGGSGSGSPSDSPRPSDTPKPSETPH